MTQQQQPRRIDAFLSHMDKHEGGGGYDTLFAFSNRKGPFAGVDVTQMSIGQVKEFSAVGGQYGQWVKSKVGRVATPMGRYQFVGTTMKAVAAEMGLSDDTLFSPEVQDAMFEHYMDKRLSGQSTLDGKINAARAGWEGFKNVPREQLAQAIMSFEGGSSGSFNPTDFSKVSFAPTSADIPDFDRKPVRNVQSADPSLWETTKDAAAGTDTAYLIQAFGRADRDPNWSLPPQAQLEEDLKSAGVPAETYTPWFGEVGSAAEYQQKLFDVSSDHQRIQRLQSAGMAGVGLQVAASILDPVSLVAEVGAASVTGPIAIASKAGRVARVTQSALQGAAAGLATESVGAIVNPHKDEMDILYGTVLGAGVGGVVGSLLRRTETESAGLALERVARNELEGREARGFTSGLTDAPSEIDTIKAFDKDLFARLRADEIPNTFLPEARFDFHAILSNSKIPGVRAFAGALQDGVGKVNGAINPFSVDEDLARLTDEFMSASHRYYNPALKDYMAENNVPLHQRHIAEGKFRSEIDAYMREAKISAREGYSKAVSRVGDQMSKLYDEMLTLLQNPWHREGLSGRSVEGFDKIKRRSNYAPRSWDNNRLTLANQQHGKKKMQSLFMGAFRSANPDIEERVVKEVGKAFYRAVLNRAVGLDDVAMRSLSQNEMDRFVKVLVDDGGLDVNDAEYLVKTFARPKDAGRDASARRRVALDENYGVKGLKLSDLFVTDSLTSFARYANNASRMIALARFRLKDPKTGDLIVDGITSDDDFAKYAAATRKQGAEAVRSGRITADRLEKDMEHLELAYALLRGKPPKNMTDARWMRMLKDFNYTRVMNQVGFAQLPEIAVIITEVGVKAAFSQIPSVRRLINSSGEQVLKNPLTQDLEEFLALGTDGLRAKSRDFFDDFTGSNIDMPNDRVEQAAGVLRAGTRVTSAISGMDAINAFAQRLAAQSALQKFANMAFKGEVDLAARRMAALGLDTKMTERIMKELRRPEVIETVPGVITSKKVARFNMNGWEDLEAREAFRAAMYRWGTSMVQRNFIGNNHPLANHWFAKLLLQFRSFMLGAWSKQTLRMAYNRDSRAFMTAAWTMMTAGAAYTAQTHIQSIGREDREKFLERRLSWDKITTAAFARSSAASIIPMLLDSGAAFAGQDRMFSHTRTTGQVSDIILGNPSTGYLFEDVPQATSGIIRGLTEGGYSQEEARDLLRIMPWSNALPVLIPFQKMIGDLPEYRKEDR